MKTVESEGLCIKAIDYGDADKLVTVYLRGIGKILCRARGVRKPNAKLKHAVAAFNYGNYILIENNGYFTLRSCETIETHSNIGLDIERYYLSSFMLELLDKFAREGDEIDNLLDTVLNFLNDIEKSTSLRVCNAYLYEFISRAGFEFPIYTIPLANDNRKDLISPHGKSLPNNDFAFFRYMVKHIEQNGEIKLKTVNEIANLYSNFNADND